jgi:hypothetical protein
MSKKKKKEKKLPRFEFAKDLITLQKGHFLHMLSEAHDKGYWEGQRRDSEKSEDIWNVIEEQYDIDHLKDEYNGMRGKTLI